MEQLRLQGVQFTSQHDLAESFECSPSTINRAIKQTPTLQVWAKQPDAAPRVVGQTRNEKQDEVSRDKPFLSRELTPDDQAAINEYLDRKDHPEGWKEFFGGLLSQTQLEFINNPKRLKSLQAMYRKKVGDAKSE